MPITRRRTRMVTSGSRRRKLVWATFRGDIALGAAPQFNNVDLLGNFRTAGASVLGCTIMRTRGVIYVDNTGRAVGSKGTVSLLVGRLSDIGGTVNLAGDSGQDLAYTRMVCPVSAYGAIGQENLEIDLRARRKCQELDQTWVLATSNDAGPVLTLRCFVRTLIALP